MTEQVSYDDVKPGAELALVSYPVTRLSLVRYCGASGDFNVIHWNERIARSVGLPNVIAHGMFTMAEAGRYVTDWAGPRAVVVEEKLDDNRVVLVLTARSGGEKVLTRAKAVVRLP